MPGFRASRPGRRYGFSSADDQSRIARDQPFQSPQGTLALLRYAVFGLAQRKIAQNFIAKVFAKR
jgi:hypothetical protein